MYMCTSVGVCVYKRRGVCMSAGVCACVRAQVCVYVELTHVQ